MLSHEWRSRGLNYIQAIDSDDRKQTKKFLGLAMEAFQMAGDLCPELIDRTKTSIKYAELKEALFDMANGGGAANGAGGAGAGGAAADGAGPDGGDNGGGGDYGLGAASATPLSPPPPPPANTWALEKRVAELAPEVSGPGVCCCYSSLLCYFLLLPSTSYCSWCLLLVCRRSTHATLRDTNPRRHLPLSPASCNPSKLTPCTTIHPSIHPPTVAGRWYAGRASRALHLGRE